MCAKWIRKQMKTETLQCETTKTYTHNKFAHSQNSMVLGAFFGSLNVRFLFLYLLNSALPFFFVFDFGLSASILDFVCSCGGIAFPFALLIDSALNAEMSTSFILSIANFSRVSLRTCPFLYFFLFFVLL